jgi:hypothetical protein
MRLFLDVGVEGGRVFDRNRAVGKTNRPEITQRSLARCRSTQWTSGRRRPIVFTLRSISRYHDTPLNNSSAPIGLQRRYCRLARDSLSASSRPIPRIASHRIASFQSHVCMPCIFAVTLPVGGSWSPLLPRLATYTPLNRGTSPGHGTGSFLPLIRS